MIELKLKVSDIDYDSVIRTLSGGGVAGGAAAFAAKAVPDGAKEDFAVKYLNNNARKLESMLETAAAKKGIQLRISDAQATIVE